MKKHSLEVFNEETNVNFYGWKLILDGFYFTNALRKYLPTVPKVQTAYLVKDHGQTAIDTESWFAIGKLLLDKLKRRAVPLERLTREHEQLAAEIYNLYVLVVNADLKRAKNADFLRWFSELWQSYHEINSIGMIPVLSDFYHSLLSKDLEKIFQKRELSDVERQNYMNVLMSPDKPNTAWHEQLEFLNLVRRFKTPRSLETSSAYQNHIRKYQWINYGYQGPKIRSEDFLVRAVKFLKEKRKLGKEIRDHKNYFKRLIKRQRKLEKKLKLSETEKYLFRSARRFTYLKGCRVDARHYFHFASDLMFAELAKRFRVPLNLFRFADPREIAALLRGQKTDKKTILARSRQVLWVYERGRGGRFVPQGQIKKFLKTYVRDPETTESTEITGQIAYLGKAIGKAKIVNSVKDINKVEHGDILVSITTNPDLLPAMYRAIAFVTDIGGITSHAAIVSRELRKPCVIGTKFATKVFKDGDMIEVDAEKGIVRKI